MSVYRELYDFAASAGSFEGYVYRRTDVDPGYLPKWSGNLLRQYRALPEEVKEEVQAMCDGTIGRAILSLLPVVGEDNEAIANLREILQGEMPLSPDDFDKH